MASVEVKGDARINANLWQFIKIKIAVSPETSPENRTEFSSFFPFTSENFFIKKSFFVLLCFVSRLRFFSGILSLFLPSFARKGKETR